MYQFSYSEILEESSKDCRQREYDLFDRAIEHAERLFGFEAGGIVILGDEDREEEGAEAAFAGAGEVELAVGLARPDVAAVIEDAVDGVDVAVEDERLRAQRGGSEKDRIH